MTGLPDWLTTADHKKIGRLYLVSALAFGAAALVLQALVGFERMDPSSAQIFKANAVDQIFSLASIGMVFLVVAPLLLGLAIAVVPLQVGARSIAFPRAAALSYWTWLVGGGLMIGAYAMNGGPGGGDRYGIRLFDAAFGIVVLGLLIGSLCVATTVLTLRAPGMGLRRVPFFAWGSMVGGVMLLLTLPAVLGNLVILYIDHRAGRPIGIGSGAQIGPHLAWAISQPQIYAYTVPALGLVADVFPVFARSRQRLTSGLMLAIGAAGLLGFGAWAQTQYAPKLTTEFVFVLMALAAVVPPLAVLVFSTATLRGAKAKAAAPLVFALVAGLAAAGAGAMGMLTPVKGLHLLGTAYAQGHTDAVLYAGLLAGLGGLVYWGPKLWGRCLPDGPAKGLAALGLLAALAATVPLFVAGFIDQPYGTVVGFTKEDGTAALNGIAGGGAAALALVVVAMLALSLRGFLKGAPAGDDPWRGHTLEWATSSPPPAGNFQGPLPPVTSEQPLLDLKEGN